MKNNILLHSCLILCLMVLGCSPKSASIRSEKPLVNELVTVPPYKETPPQTVQWITEDGGQSQLDFNPQVDILFIIDNSDSMVSAQENIAKNIDRFTAGITKNKMMDYHVGVISVWDSTKADFPNKKDNYGIGELRRIKSENGNVIERRFVTKDDKKMMGSTLKIGVTPLSEGGPENEELFSPLAAALEKTGRGATNEDFFRENAQLVVILVTDADDGSKSITPEMMAQKLVDFKGKRQNKVSVYGVITRAENPDSSKDWDLRIHPKYHKECFTLTAKNTYVNNGTCKGFGPVKLEQFILTVNSYDGTPEEIKKNHIMNIISPNFGADLGRIGEDITVKTLAKQIFLSQRPRLDDNGNLMIRVRYGKQIIPQKAKGGWLYNPENNSIYLSGDIDYHYEEGARFFVDLVPVTLD
ncbi:MAG: hypothetical protein ACXVCP_16865 [Bdellovibrio sp.]